MTRKYIFRTVFATLAIAFVADAFATPRYEQEIQDYIVVENAESIIQLTAFGSGPSPSLASQTAKKQLHFKCAALRGQLLGFPSITVHGGGVSYTAIAYQGCLVSD
jgi:hypothetical protein